MLDGEDRECDDELYLQGPNICQLDGMDDDVLDLIESESEIEDVNKGKGTQINIINTNARSLCPKIGSLIDCFEELDGTLGIITETWLADGESLDQDVADLARGAGLGMVCLLYTSPSPRDRQKSRMPSSA